MKFILFIILGISILSIKRNKQIFDNSFETFHLRDSSKSTGITFSFTENAIRFITDDPENIFFKNENLIELDEENYWVEMSYKNINQIDIIDDNLGKDMVVFKIYKTSEETIFMISLYTKFEFSSYTYLPEFLDFLSQKSIKTFVNLFGDNLLKFEHFLIRENLLFKQDRTFDLYSFSFGYRGIYFNFKDDLIPAYIENSGLFKESTGVITENKVYIKRFLLPYTEIFHIDITKVEDEKFQIIFAKYNKISKNMTISKAAISEKTLAKIKLVCDIWTKQLNREMCSKINI